MSCIEKPTSSMACVLYREREADDFGGVCLVQRDQRVRWRVSCSMACVLYRESPTSSMACVLYRERDRRVRWRVPCTESPTSSMARVSYRESIDFDGMCLV